MHTDRLSSLEDHAAGAPASRRLHDPSIASFVPPLIAAVLLDLTPAPIFAQDITATETPPDTEEAALDFTGATLFDTVVVTANKFPLENALPGSSVSLLPAKELERKQINNLENALKLVPGTAIASNGAPGSNSSIFLRGTNSNQTQIVVDGIRVSDSNILPNPFLGAEELVNLDSIEVLRGPQSSLYGGEAIGGVISLFTRRGTGDPSLRFFTQAGSFNTLRAGVSGQGAADAFAYSFSTGIAVTDNDRPNNEFEQTHASLRIDMDLGEDTALAFTARQAYRRFGSPGSTAVNDPDNLDTDSSRLLATRIDHSFNDVWESNLTVGFFTQDLDFEDPPVKTGIDSNKFSAEWKNVLRLNDRNTSLLGVATEHTSVENSGFGAIDQSERIVSLFALHTLDLTDSFSVTAGARWENYDTFGGVWTYRSTASYRVDKTGTRIFGSYGSGFRAPSFFEQFAQSPSFVGNPFLDPEKSRGWDIGIEQNLPFDLVASATWFHNDIDNLITSDFTAFPSTVINLQEATTRGVELSLKGALGQCLDFSFAYTYLEAINDTTAMRLLRRPRHTLAFDVQSQVNDRLLLGLGGYLVDDRLDVDAVTFATIEGDNYFVARAYSEISLRENVTLQLRIENLFDENYDEINGFPGLPLGGYAGIIIEF